MKPIDYIKIDISLDLKDGSRKTLTYSFQVYKDNFSFNLHDFSDKAEDKLTRLEAGDIYGLKVSSDSEFYDAIAFFKKAAGIV